MTVLKRLVEVAREAAERPDLDALRARLLTNLAVALGRNQETIRFREGLVDDAGPGATAFGLAAAMHARTQDDFHPAGRVHVGTVVIPAIVAIGRGELFPAMAAGYEVLTAVAAAYSRPAQRRGYRPTAIFGPMGSAAAAATALGLDDDGLGSALALASAVAAGTNQSWIDGTDEWLLEVAAASRSGVDAARLAGAGLRGAPGAFDGPAGWASAYFDDPGAPALREVLEDGVGRTRAVAVKLFPISGIAQVPAQLAAGLGDALRHAVPDGIEVRMSPPELDYPGSRNRGPFAGRSDSLMSIARCVALAYLHGNVPYDLLEYPPGGEEREVMGRVQLMADPDLDETEAVVSVTMGGETSTRRAHGDELLYPTWSETEGQHADIARRSEAPEETIAELAAVVGGDPDVSSITAAMEDRT